MKKLLFSLFFFGFCFLASGQSQPQVGDQLIIKQPNEQVFRYVKFPKLNILTKRGKIANYKSVYGNEVIIDKVITKKDGSLHVILKKKDGSKFFGYLTKVKANYNKALKAKEIAVVK